MQEYWEKVLKLILIIWIKIKKFEDNSPKSQCLPHWPGCQSQLSPSTQWRRTRAEEANQTSFHNSRVLGKTSASERFFAKDRVNTVWNLDYSGCFDHLVWLNNEVTERCQINQFFSVLIFGLDYVRNSAVLSIQDSQKHTLIG